MFLRIREWTVFLASATLAFLVELLGVLWVTRGEDFVRTARDTLMRAKALDLILDKIEAAVTIDDATDSSNLEKLLLTTKIAHEELCEKASLVRCVHLCPEGMKRLVLTYWTYVWFCEKQVRQHFINLADNKRAKPKAAGANGRAGGPRSGGRSDQRVDLSPSRYFRSYRACGFPVTAVVCCRSVYFGDC